MFSQNVKRSALIGLPALGLAAGFACPLFGQTEWQAWTWTAFTIPVLFTRVFRIFASLRKGDVRLDIVAALSMTAALVISEYLAAIEIALM
jgi:cation transport ATPase